jgi:hypothetical protein
MNTSTLRTRTRKTLLVALLPLFAAPLVTQADTVGAHSDAAMDACVNAFVSSSLEKERPYTVQKSESAASPLDQHARAYRIALTATGKTSGKKVAKATCVVDRSGVVLSLNGKPYSSTALAQTTVLSAR